MPYKDALITELKGEAVSTRKMLERVPQDKFSWRPHDKSMTIGRLAAHIAEIPVWVNRTLDADFFDFTTLATVRSTYEDSQALLKVFEERQEAALTALAQASDEILDQKFAMRRGEVLMFEMSRKSLIRRFAFNHVVHHRGQLSVYLRLLDIAVPGMYGPSADEK